MLWVCGKVGASPEARSPARERGQGEGAESGTGAGDLGQEGEGSDLHSPPLGKAVDRLYGAPSCLDPGLPLWPLLFCVQSQASLRGSSSGVSGKRAEHGPTDGLCLPLLPNPEPGRVP